MSTVIGLIALFVSLSLLGRVKRLEKLIAKSTPSMSSPVHSDTLTTSPVSVTPARPQTAPSSPTATVSTPVSASVAPTFLSEAIEWMAKDWLMKLGAVLLFLGIGWIVTTFFWDAIGPVGHVSIGFFIGIAFLVFGKSRIGQHRNQGGVFVVLGAGVVYLTTYVASPVSYNLISPVVATGFMFLTAVFVTYLAVATRTFSVALFGLLLGLMAPLLSGSTHASFVQVFLYLLILSMGTLWVGGLTKWRSLTLLSVIAYGAYSLPYFGNYGELVGDSLVAMLVIMFGTLYFVAGLNSIVMDREVVATDLWVTVINSLLALMWIYILIPGSDGRALMCVCVAVAASIGAFIAYQKTRLQGPVAVHTLSSVAFIVAATAFALDGPLFRLAIMMEATSALILWRYFFGVEAVQKVAWISVAPIFLGALSLFEYATDVSVFGSYSSELFDENFVVVITAALLLIFYGRLCRDSNRFEGKDATTSQFFTISGSALALTFFWFFAERLMPGDTGTMLALFVYTIIGLILYISGKLWIREIWKAPGAALLAFVVGHLLLIDIGGMDTIGRIVTFTLIGLLLISTSFIHKKE